MQSTSICQQCSNTFQPGPGTKGIYCSLACTKNGIRRRYRSIAQTQLITKIQHYDQNPSHCAQCKSTLEYKKRKNKFCSSSCAATFNNTGRVRSDESKKALSVIMRHLHARDPLLGTKSIRSGPANARYKDGRYIPKLRNCLGCNTQFHSARKTCSRECLIAWNRRRASENLRKNRHKYQGPHLRSYMEKSFAEWLDAKHITKGVYGYMEQVHFKHKVDGRTKNGWADFVFVSRRLIIELDGTHHRNRVEFDKVRDEYLATKRGYNVIRITHREYQRQTRLAEIEKLLGI